MSYSTLPTALGALFIVLVLFGTDNPASALILYAACGLVWVVRERRQPLAQRPLGYGSQLGTVVLWMIWPVRVIKSVREKKQIRASEDRYSVHGPAGGFVASFGDWDEAVVSASQVARDCGEEAYLFDRSRTAATKHLKEIAYVSWRVSAEGVVREGDL